MPGWVALIPAGLLAIIALIMSIVAVSKGSPKGALVVSIIAIVLTLAACGAPGMDVQLRFRLRGRTQDGNSEVCG